MNELKLSKPTKNLKNYIFVKDIIKIEGDVDMDWGLAPITLTIPNYDSSMVLCLLKDNLVMDTSWRYLNKQEQMKKIIVARGMMPTYNQPRYFFRYKSPDTEKVITIECGEYFLIDYVNKKDIKEFKKVTMELKGE